MRPSLFTAASISVTRFGPELAATRCSMRSSTHFTGRPVIFAASAISTTNGNTESFMPKLPPESGGMRSRNFGPGTRSARAITGCIENGPWKLAVTS